MSKTGPACPELWMIHLLSFFFTFWPHSATCRILVPQPAVELALPALEGIVLTTGAPRKFYFPS